MNNIDNQSHPSNLSHSSDLSDPSPRIRNKDNFFYYDSLTEREKELYDRGGIDVNNLDAEIKLLKLRLSSLALDPSVNPGILARFISIINACIKTNVKALNRVDQGLDKYRRTLQIMFKDRLPPREMLEQPIPAPPPGQFEGGACHV